METEVFTSLLHIHFKILLTVLYIKLSLNKCIQCANQQKKSPLAVMSTMVLCKHFKYANIMQMYTKYSQHSFCTAKSVHYHIYMIMSYIFKDKNNTMCILFHQNANATVTFLLSYRHFHLYQS